MKNAHHQRKQQADVPSLTDLAEVELSKYVAAPCQPRASNPLTWWHDNMARFPLTQCGHSTLLGGLCNERA